MPKASPTIRFIEVVDQKHVALTGNALLVRHHSRRGKVAYYVKVPGELLIEALREAGVVYIAPRRPFRPEEAV